MTAAAVCPQAPGLVPALGQGIAAELAEVRAACLDAVAAVAATIPLRIVVVGDGAGASFDQSAGGSLAGFGVDVRAGGPKPVLPPSLTIGAWLLDQVGWQGPRGYTSQFDAGAGDAVLVMSDGSSRHRRLAPEWADIEGRAFDAEVGKALAAGDADALASLDLAVAEQVGATGVAGLVALGEHTRGSRIAAHLRYDGAPFDVGYWVADWQLAPAVDGRPGSHVAG